MSWCLIRTVRRGWTRVPPTGPVQRPLYSAGTAARIERLRVSHPTGCARAHASTQAGLAGQTLWWEEAGRRQF